MERIEANQAGAKTKSGGKIIVGLAGGIGSGKSTVAKLFGALGAVVISSDQLNSEELASPEVIATLKDWWGEDVMSGGALDRRKIARRIFAEPAERARLERLLHPRIARRRDQLLAELNRRADVRMIVIDSPLLYETGLNRICDRVVFVETEQAQRAARSEKDRGWEPGELSRRENNQEPLDNKRASADYVCVNNSTPDALRNCVQDIFSKLLSEFKSE